MTSHKNRNLFSESLMKKTSRSLFLSVLACLSAATLASCSTTPTRSSGSSYSMASMATSPTYGSGGTYVPGDQHWGGNAVSRPLSQEEIMSGSVADLTQGSLDTGREKMIQVAAVSLGSKAGMSARAQEIQQALMVRAQDYDKAFNFSVLMLEPGFLPPVITEGFDAYNQPNDNEARASDCMFRIERPARITPVAPTWRTYLLEGAPPAVRPDGSVLPKGADEKRLWDYWAQVGWNQGAHLADQNYEANLARLTQDFRGMLRFKILYELGAVNKPILARANLGTTGGGNEMAVNDRIIRITKSASLDANRKNWSTKNLCEMVRF